MLLVQRRLFLKSDRRLAAHRRYVLCRFLGRPLREGTPIIMLTVPHVRLLRLLGHSTLLKRITWRILEAFHVCYRKPSASILSDTHEGTSSSVIAELDRAIESLA